MALGSVRPFRISLKIALAFALVLALPSVVIGYQISGHRNDDQAPALVRSSQTDSPLLLVYSDGSAAIPASGAAGNTQVFPEGTYSFDPTTNSTGYRLHASSDVASLSQLALAGDGLRLIGLSWSDGRNGLHVFDAFDGSLISSVDLGRIDGGIHSLASVNGDRIFVPVFAGTGQTSSLVSIDASTGERAWESPLGDDAMTLGVDLSPDGRAIFITGYSDRIMVVDATSGSIIDKIETPRLVESPYFSWWHEGVFSPDGRHYYAVNAFIETDSVAVAVIDVANRRIVRTEVVSFRGDPSASGGLGQSVLGRLLALFCPANVAAKVPPSSGSVSLSPGGRRLYIANWNALIVIDPTTLKLVAVPIRSEPRKPSINGVVLDKDGSKAYVTVGTQIHILDIAGDEFVEIGTLAAPAHATALE